MVNDGYITRANQLFLNVSKTQAMLYGICRRLCNVDTLNITLDSQVIKRVYESKYFGPSCEVFSWNTHLKYLLTRAGKRVGMLSHIGKNLKTHFAIKCHLYFLYQTCFGLLRH